MGEFFLTKIGDQPVVFQHGGWGKISTAASTEYAIQQWDSELAVNLPGKSCTDFVTHSPVG